jgi:hypothetical protein
LGAFGVDLGAAIASATVGATRYPYINAEPGEYTVRIVKTIHMENTNTFVVEMDIVESTRPDVRPPGARVSWVQPVSGDGPAMIAARHGALLAFILRSAGFATVEDAEAKGWQRAQIATYVNQCRMEPGPLAGRLVRVNVTPSSRTTGAGETINNVNWSPYG